VQFIQRGLFINEVYNIILVKATTPGFDGSKLNLSWYKKLLTTKNEAGIKYKKVACFQTTFLYFIIPVTEKLSQIKPV
jgi:hypothetical protein